MKHEANEAAKRLLELQVKALVACEGVIMCLIDENSSLEKEILKERTKYDKVFASGSVFDSYKQSFKKIENLLGNRRISPEEIYVEVKNLLERRKDA